MPQWGALATGAQDGLDKHLKRILAEREMQVAEQNAAAQEEYRQQSIAVARQNAESLAEQRKAAAEEKNMKAASKRQRDEWAKTTVAGGMPQVTDDKDPRQRVALLQYYRAKHYAETGEDLPDAVVTNLLTPRPERQDPNLLSPEAMAQWKTKQGIINAGRAASGSGAAAARAQAKIDANSAVQNYLQAIVAKNPKWEHANAMLQRPDVQQDFLRKSQGQFTLPQFKAMVYKMYQDPESLKAYFEQDAKRQMIAAQQQPPEDPENDWPGM
jgi:hypothetical protein